MAQTISTKYAAQLSNELRWARGYIYIIDDAATIADDGHLIEYKIQTQLQNDKNIFGNTVCKYATIKIQNPGNTTYADLIGKRLSIHAGLTLDIGEVTESIEYLPQGVFRILNVKEDKDNESLTLECYDAMVRFNVPYVEAGTYPMTLSAFVAMLAASVGLELGNTSFNNSTMSITEQPNVAANEYQTRALLGWAAELAGGNAVMGTDNKLYIKGYNKKSVFTIGPEVYFKNKVSPVYGPITGVSMVREALNDTIYYPDPLPDGVTMRVIDNMVNYNQRAAIVDDIHNIVNGISYSPFELSWRGTGHLEFMDYITIDQTQNNTNLFSLSNLYNYAGGALGNNTYYTINGKYITATNQNLNSALPGQKVAVTGTTTYTVSGTHTGSSISIYYRCYDSSGVATGTQVSAGSAAVTNGVYTKTFTVVPPANTAYMAIGIGDVTQSNYTVSVKLEVGTSATPWDENLVSSSYVMNSTLVFNGALSEELSAFAYTPAASAVKNPGQAAKRSKLTEARVDKVEGEITLIAADVDALEGSVAQLVIDTQTITSTVEQTNENLETLSTQLQQTASSLTATITDVDEIQSYYQFTADSLTIGKSSSPAQIKIGIVSNKATMTLTDGTANTATIQSDTMFINNVEIVNTLEIGNHKVQTLTGSTTRTIWLPLG